MKKLTIILFIITILFTAEKCKKGDGDVIKDAKIVEKTYGEELFQRWIHSKEEDEDRIEVYRHPEYNFPPARGRDGFKINKDGSFYFITPGPTDKPELSSRGDWSLDENVLIIKYDGTGHEYMGAETKMEILSIENGVLKIKKY